MRFVASIRPSLRGGRSIDRLTGSDKVRLAIDAGTLAPLLEQWDREAAEFLVSRKPYLLVLRALAFFPGVWSPRRSVQLLVGPGS